MADSVMVTSRPGGQWISSGACPVFGIYSVGRDLDSSVTIPRRCRMTTGGNFQFLANSAIC